MNIVATAENAGRLHTVPGGAALQGVSVTNMPTRRDAGRPSTPVDDDDDFATLLNPSKRLEADQSMSANASDAGRSDQYPDVASMASMDGADSTGMDSRGDRDGMRGDMGGSSMGGSFGNTEGFKSLEEEKQHYLQKIQTYNARGIPSHRHVSIDTPLEELKYEYHRLKRIVTMNHSIKFQRRILMAFVTGSEFINKKFNPLNLRLDGWSESVMDGIEEYDQVFEQLHDKYSGTADVEPEWQLMMMVLGSGFMFHLSNTLFRSVLPNVNDIAKQNPDLMQNIANAMSDAMQKKSDTETVAQSGDGGAVPSSSTSVRASTAQMGTDLAMQAMQSMMNGNAAGDNDDNLMPPAGAFDAPFQHVVDPGLLPRAQSTRLAGLDADARSEAASSDISGISDLRSIAGGRRRARKKGDEDNSIDIQI